MRLREIYLEGKKKFADIPCPGCGDPKCDHKEEHMDEGTRCWKGYKKKGMKTMFGKRVPNCVKKEAVEEDQYEILYKNSKDQITSFQSGLTKQQADDKIYKLVKGIRQWGNDPSKLNFDNEKMDPQRIILKKNGEQIPLPYGNVQEVNTGNPHKGKYMIKTDMPGRKDSDLVIMPDEEAAKDMVASLSKKNPDVKYWVELVEYNNWDNPTNDELERERQGADNFVLDRRIAGFEKQLQKDKQQNKKYNYEKKKRDFYRDHDAKTAEKMLYMMQQKGLFN